MRAAADHGRPTVVSVRYAVCVGIRLCVSPYSTTQPHQQAQLIFPLTTIDPITTVSYSLSVSFPCTVESDLHAVLEAGDDFDAYCATSRLDNARSQAVDDHVSAFSATNLAAQLIFPLTAIDPITTVSSSLSVSFPCTVDSDLRAVLEAGDDFDAYYATSRLDSARSQAVDDRVSAFSSTNPASVQKRGNGVDVSESDAFARWIAGDPLVCVANEAAAGCSSAKCDLSP